MREEKVMLFGIVKTFKKAKKRTSRSFAKKAKQMKAKRALLITKKKIMNKKLRTIEKKGKILRKRFSF